MKFSKAKPVVSTANPADMFDWDACKKTGFGTGRDREGVNLVVSSSIEKSGASKIVFSFSEELLAKLRWRIGDKVAIGFAARNNQTIVVIKIDPNGRTITKQSGRGDVLGLGGVAIPYRESVMPILPIKYTRLDESDFDFSIPGVFDFDYPQNAEVNAR